MLTFVVLCTDRTEVEFQTDSTRAASHDAFRAATAAGKRAFSWRPKGCTGLSATAHLGNACPVHTSA